MIYGIILVIFYLAAIGYNVYVHRTPESSVLFHEKQIEKAENQSRWIHYTSTAIAAILDLSLVGYVIYALTTL